MPGEVGGADEVPSLGGSCMTWGNEPHQWPTTMSKGTVGVPCEGLCPPGSSRVFWWLRLTWGFLQSSSGVAAGPEP